MGDVFVIILTVILLVPGSLVLAFLTVRAFGSWLNRPAPFERHEIDVTLEEENVVAAEPVQEEPTWPGKPPKAA